MQGKGQESGHGMKTDSLEIKDPRINTSRKGTGSCGHSFPEYEMGSDKMEQQKPKLELEDEEEGAGGRNEGEKEENEKEEVEEMGIGIGTKVKDQEQEKGSGMLGRCSALFRRLMRCQCCNWE